MLSLVLAWLLSAQPASPLEIAQMKVESRGDTRAVGSSGERGLWQVSPVGWQAVGQELGLSKEAFRSPAWKSARYLLHLPRVNLSARRLVMQRWERRSRGQLEPALRAYNCGNEGLLSKCGSEYLSRLKRAGGVW